MIELFIADFTWVKYTVKIPSTPLIKGGYKMNLRQLEAGGSKAKKIVYLTEPIAAIPFL